MPIWNSCPEFSVILIDLKLKIIRQSNHGRKEMDVLESKNLKVLKYLKNKMFKKGKKKYI